jgi:hypothetical protein
MSGVLNIEFVILRHRDSSVFVHAEVARPFALVLTRLKHGDRVLPQWQHIFLMLAPTVTCIHL